MYSHFVTARFLPHYHDQIPYMTLREYIDLIEELLRVRLDGMPTVVERATDELESALAQAESRLVSLGGAYDPEVELRECEFESQTDKFASMVRGCVGFASMMHDPAIVAVLDKGVELDAEQQRKREQEREQGERSRRLLEGLFGEDAHEYFRTSYIDRSRALSAMLRTLSDGELDVELQEIIQEPLRSRAEALSAIYDEHARRYLRERDEAASFIEQHAALRFAIAHYIYEVGQTADRWSKDSCDRVNSAIWPLVDCCRRMNSKH
jgi:hypothetical protein